MNRVAVKICGITNLEDAKVCAAAGADMIGLQFYPGSPRCIQPEAARAIVETLEGALEPVAIFVDATADDIRRLARFTGIRTVQLHGHAAPEMCALLARELRVIRALRIGPKHRPEDAAAYKVFAILLDAYHAQLHGGTGLTCDWTMAAATKPFAERLILAGGLNPTNAADAIAAVAPHAVDASSGLERAPGFKDPELVRMFIQKAHAAALMPCPRPTP